MTNKVKEKLTVVKNVNILTMDSNNSIIENGVVVIKDDTIFEIGNSYTIDKYKKENAVIIDGEEGILMPGMINCHTHSSMVLFRSLADDHKDRLKKYLFPLEKKLVDKYLVYVGAKYAIAEMLLGGVTTFCDMYYFEDEVAKAADELGIRGVLCETIVDFPSPDSKISFGGLDYSVEYIEKWKNHKLIIPGVAPHAPYTNSDDSLRKAYDISKKYKVPLTMHVAEMDYEITKYRYEREMTPVEYLESLGILDNNFILAHCILVNNNDLDILAKYNIGVSHNIAANAKGAKGVSPILKMKDKGINVGLGTDGPMSSNTLDIIGQLHQVGKIHKLFNNDRTLLPSIELVEMATIGGARVLGLDKKIGSIEVGKKADFIIFETESVNMQPIYDYYSTIVYSANASNVNTVFIDGRLVVENKKLVISDLKEIRNGMLSFKKRVEEIAKIL